VFVLLIKLFYKLENCRKNGCYGKCTGILGVTNIITDIKNNITKFSI